MNLIDNNKSLFVLFKQFYIIKGITNNYFFKILKKYKKKNLKFIFLKSQLISLKENIKKIKNSLKNGYVFSLYIKGLGFNIFKDENNILKINLNLSHSIIFKIPFNLKIVVNKDILYLFSYSYVTVMKYSMLIYKLRKLNKYKEVGILLINKKYKYKLGKQKK